MDENILERLIEHSNWANLVIIQACSALTDEQLDAAPQSATKGNLRQTLLHLVRAQQGYLNLLTLPIDQRPDTHSIAFAELQESAAASGQGLLALAWESAGETRQAPLQTTDGYTVEPWLVMVQALDHAGEHREQIKSMLSALGVTPPEVDGWNYGEYTKAVRPVSG